MLLADYGAEVVKIEPPEGDTPRQWPPIHDGDSGELRLVSAKKSIALDLKNPADLDLARRLVLEADVLVENNRAGAMERLGLGWSWRSARKPSLIYCAISAYGQDGPRSGEGGFDLTMQAAAGVMSVTGETEGAPVKCGVPISDFTAGLYAAFTIAAALARCAPTPSVGAATSTCPCSPPRWRWARCRPANTSAPAATRAGWARRTRAMRPTRRSAAPMAGSPSPPATRSCGARCAPSPACRTCFRMRASPPRRCGRPTRRR